MNFKLDTTNVIYSFSKDNPKVLEVPSGSIVEIETLDCFSNQIQNDKDALKSIDLERVNPATGPIFIKEALKGDTLKVTIENIEIKNQGVISTGKDLGTLGYLLKGLDSKIIPIKDNKAIFNDIEISLNPMIGVIGVAPKKASINCGTPGNHGGNMDNKAIKKGSILYLPIATNGALFALGDLHASMGDGEIGISGIEIPGKVTVKLEVLKEFKTENPILEDKDSLYTIASAETVDEAAILANEDMLKLLSKKISMKTNEIIMLMSIICNTEICQIVNPLKTVRVSIPKSILNQLDFKIN